MQIEKTKLEGCYLIAPKRFIDERGFFSETYNSAKLAALGIEVDFVQDNHSMSAKIGTLRGLHYQSPPHAQDKLVRVVHGRVIDVAVDVRLGSPSYGQHIAVELSAENGMQLFIPQGFLHGFVTLEKNTEFLYKVSDVYAPDCDGSIKWDDSDLAVNWGFEGEVTVSDKDRLAPSFASWTTPFIYGENC